ncbi:MAG: enoyl-CoA hydratase/isomerase family protein [Panacagrimonas sp.]|nr:enoyl-CoA hydratase/isomerase family protein [Panacagrimonas sp.]
MFACPLPRSRMVLSNPVPVVASSTELAAWARDPTSASRFGALAERPWLLVHTSTDDARVCAWLRALPCPVIGVGCASNAACDATVAALPAAAPLLRTIAHSPLAAALLVQVLRAVETLPTERALLVESLAYATLQGGTEFARWRATHTPGRTRDDPGPAVLVSRDEAATLRMTLNRPSRRNAMTVEMRDALLEALQLALIDRSIATICIDAAGRCFSTGGDLDEFGSAPDPASAHLVRQLALPGRLLWSCADRCVVRVHGACIGSGIEFPAFASRIEAASDSWFQLPELRYGLIPGAGGCVSLSRRIGRQRTAWMALSGARIDARTALEWGLVDAIDSRG